MEVHNSECTSTSGSAKSECTSTSVTRAKKYAETPENLRCTSCHGMGVSMCLWATESDSKVLPCGGGGGGGEAGHTMQFLDLSRRPRDVYCSYAVAALCSDCESLILYDMTTLVLCPSWRGAF